ncbi:MAG: L,D-transpeptidase [Clostridia bacterium]|nr:L,D-transpeptidase [Clostridia bacterium]
MKKNKSTKAKNKRFVRILIILSLILVITIIGFKTRENSNKKIQEAAARDSFVSQSILVADNLKKEYTDIESLEEDDTVSFVSDAAIKTGKSEYYIRVNYGANCVNIYTKDDEKNYTVPYKAMICSTGISTPKSGTYQITYKYRWLRLFGNVYGQYSTRIVKNILFHSVPYFKQRADTLEYEEYDKLGTKASAGCIRLTVEDSKWIYDNIPSGTYVEFYSDPDNPGPLGKPKAQKISDNEECRDWDPTDPDKNNPWNGGSGIPSVTYTENKSNTKKNTSNKTNTSNNKTNNTSSNSSTNTKNNSTNTNTNNKNNNTNKTTTTNNIKDEVIKDNDNDKVNENKNSNKNNTIKDTNTTTNTNTDSSNDTTTEKPKPNTNENANTNTPPQNNNSNKVEETSKPIEKPNTNTNTNTSSNINTNTNTSNNTTTKPNSNNTTPKPETTPPVKQDNTITQENPKEPAKAPTTETTSPTSTTNSATDTQ